MSKNLGMINHTFQDNATSLSDGEILYIRPNFNAISIEVTGTGTNTITFEGKFLHQSDFYPIPVYELPSLNVVTSTSLKGVIYQADLQGLIAIRCRVSEYTSGSATVKGRVIS